MQIPSSFTDMQPLAKKGMSWFQTKQGMTTEKLPQYINASIIKHRVQKHLENMYSFEDYKTVPKHMVFLMEENILIRITN